MWDEALPEPFLGGRVDWRDLSSTLLRGDECPWPEDVPNKTILRIADVEPGAEGLRLTPIEKLYVAAQAAGIRVLDLRGVSRKETYRANDHCVVRDGRHTISVKKRDIRAEDLDFGPWGYFRTKKAGKWVFTETPPKRGRAHGTRPWEKMTSTVVHTAAVTMHAARFIGVPAQHGIAADATIVLAQPINAYMWHANAANKFSDGIEISGKGTITANQTLAVQILLRYIDAKKAEMGVTKRLIAPHAFSQKKKPNDCGGKIWQVTGQWAQDVLGMSLGPVVGNGFHPSWVPNALRT